MKHWLSIKIRRTWLAMTSHGYCGRTWPEWPRRNTSFCFPWLTTAEWPRKNTSLISRFGFKFEYFLFIYHVSHKIPATKSKCNFRYADIPCYTIWSVFLSWYLFCFIFRGIARPGMTRWALSLHSMPICCIKECFFVLYLILCFEIVFTLLYGEIWYSIDPIQLNPAWFAGCFEILKCFWNLINPGDTSCISIFNWWDYLV